MQATIPNVSAQRYGEFVVPVPPLSEQLEIVDYLREAMRSVDVVVATLNRHIEKLREYRQALISAAVTGQIPVREEAPA